MVGLGMMLLVFIQMGGVAQVMNDLRTHFRNNLLTFAAHRRNMYRWQLHASGLLTLGSPVINLRSFLRHDDDRVSVPNIWPCQ